MVSKSTTQRVAEAAGRAPVFRKKRVTLTPSPGSWSKVDARIERDRTGENDNEGGVDRTIGWRLLGYICYHNECTLDGMNFRRFHVCFWLNLWTLSSPLVLEASSSTLVL